jgi:hypothetical protein
MELKSILDTRNSWQPYPFLSLNLVRWIARAQETRLPFWALIGCQFHHFFENSKKTLELEQRRGTETVYN